MGADKADGANRLAHASFSRPTPIDRRTARAGGMAIDIVATEAERAALADALSLDAIETLRLTGRLAPWRRDGWRFDGALGAQVRQTCGVTLDPVFSEIREDVARLWTDDGAPAPRATRPTIDVDIDAEEEDEPPEPLGDAIDFADIARETLALAIDPYPRADGASLDAASAAPPGAAPLSEEATKPFAGLAALRDALSSPVPSAPADVEPGASDPTASEPVSAPAEDETTDDETLDGAPDASRSEPR